MLLLKNTSLVNRGKITACDILIDNGRITKIGSDISSPNARIIDVAGKHVIPGIIDDQVHFREPGLTHKATIASESRAAVAGGVTAFMEMPNVNPPSINKDLLEQKYAIAAAVSPANYSFFMGTTNDNYDEVMRTDQKNVCGIKIFMGSSTGNMLVDSPSTLERIFANTPMLIATHCEDEQTVLRNNERYKAKYGDSMTAAFHPRIRNAKACYLSSSMAIELAKKHGTRLHILHISTKDEIALFDNRIPLEQKKITSEVCVHHLRFQSGDYKRFGNLIKCNPAIKGPSHHDALLPALLDNHFDIIATDHAPHTWEEKSQPYLKAPAGVPLVQHSLNIMLEFYHAGKISLERIVEKMCHAPAIVFKIKDRGFADEGAWADLAIVDVNKSWVVNKENIAYQCKWSPFENHRFKGKVLTTLVNGHPVWHEDQFDLSVCGSRLQFDR